MDQQQLHHLEEKCIQDCAPACTAGCPAHVDVRAMLVEIARGDFPAALKLYRKAVPFPGIICRICDQPCRDVCKREEAGDSIAIRALERFCVEHATPPEEKTRPLPRREGHVAIVGGGISGLTAACDLARKGYMISILDTGAQLGGSLWKIDRDYLPGEVIESDLDLVFSLGVVVLLNARVEGGLADLRDQFDALYLAAGPVTDQTFGLELNEQGFVRVDPLTRATSLDGVFAGGGLLWGKEMHSSITSISEGRRAAISIDRYLQKVSLTASRVNEGPYATCLYTDTRGVEPRPVIEMDDPDHGYEWHEATQEARRCLQCECMECVKACEYLKAYGRYPRRYVREIYNNLSIVSGTRSANTLINSCSLCGLCAELCPEGLDMAQVNQAARETMVAQKRMPLSAHDFALRDMVFSNSERFAMSRNPPGADASDFVLFPGCQLSASSPEHVERVYGYLNDRLPDQRVGLMLGCCGAPARWAGRRELFDATLAAWRDQLAALGDPMVVLPCSSCYQTFKTHLPDVKIVSLWDVFSQYGLPEMASRAGRTVTIHDPCATRHEGGIQDSVREIVGQLGYQVTELALSRERTACCSYGGHMWLANRELAQKVVSRRIAESDLDYVTYCAMCRDFFAGQGKRSLHLLDLIYGEDDDQHASRPGPGYSQRHENRARLRQTLLATIWGEDMDGSHPDESIRLNIAPQVREVLDRRLILDEDIRRVIAYAERTGRKLRSPQTGRLLAYLKPTSVTYWVEYLPDGDRFTIFNAYSHRMEVPGSGPK